MTRELKEKDSQLKQLLDREAELENMIKIIMDKLKDDAGNLDIPK
jgi:hypothetical protein